MRIATAVPAMVLSLVLLPACQSARGFDRGRLQQTMSLDQEVTEDEIGRVLDLQPQLPVPFKVGVVFRQAAGENSRLDRVDAPWTWRDRDRQGVLDALGAVEDAGLVSEAFVVGDTTVAGDDLRAMRLAAARHGADAVLVISGASALDVHENWSSVFYLTLIGAFFVPGTDIEALFLMEGTLWDVRNGYLYATVEAEGGAEDSQAAFVLHPREVVDAARARALDAFREEVRTHLQGLAP